MPRSYFLYSNRKLVYSIQGNMLNTYTNTVGSKLYTYVYHSTPVEFLDF